MEKKKTVFDTLNSISLNDKTKDKDGLAYLSWTFAVPELTKRYPDWSYEIKKFGESQLPYTYDPNTGYMVWTSVTIEGKEKEMWLPVMNGANKAMLDHPYTYKTKYGEKTVEAATMFDVNKTIMRCLVKNIAMFGLGIYIYQDEDLPEGAIEAAVDTAIEAVNAAKSDEEVIDIWNNNPMICKNERFKAAIGRRRGELAKGK